MKLTIPEREKMFEAVMNTMAEAGKIPLALEREWGHSLIHTGDPVLVSNTIALFEAYPELGYRSIKAGAYVHYGDVWVNPLLAGNSNDGIFAHVQQPNRPLGYLVGETDDGVFFCVCKDYKYNLKATPVVSGPPQQPCCHILAVALNDEKILKIFLKMQKAPS